MACELLVRCSFPCVRIERGSRPNVVDDDVETFFAGLAGEGFLEFVFGRIELDSRISSQFAEFAEGFAVAAGTNDSARAHVCADCAKDCLYAIEGR